ncbi:MAG: hypothetical protein JXA82_19065 [Sedimentisphaerales bacterium]|nr:hypothetical protein [Sedimentisphaerales bacterium]
MKRYIFPLCFIVIHFAMTYANIVPISLAPEDWELYGTPSGSYSFSQTPEGYLRVTSGYRVHVGVKSKTTVNLQGPATLRYKWRINTGGVYGATQDAPEPLSRMGSSYMTAHHSWAGSIVISNNTWIYTEVVINADKTLDYCYSYSSYGGAPIHSGLTGTYTLNDTQWDTLADADIHKTITDCYTSSPYFEIAEAYAEIAGFAATINSPPDDSYFTPDQSVSLSASAELGVEPYTFSWESDVDGFLGDGAEREVADLSLGTHTISVTCVDDANEVVVESVTIHVMAEPVLEDLASHTIGVGQSYTGPVPVLAQGSQPITYSLVEGPAGMAIDSVTGVVTWEIPDASGSPYNVAIRAENAVGSDEADYMLSVIEVPGFAEELWPRIYDGYGGEDGTDVGYEAAIDSIGNVIAAGYIDGPAGHLDSGFLIKYASDGTELWSYEYDNPPASGKAENNDRFYDVAVDSEDNIVVVGSTSGKWTNYSQGSYHNAWLIQKWTPDGQTLLWQKIWQDNYPAWSPWQSAYGVAIDADDNIIVAGNSFGYWDNTRHQWVTIKYDKDGNVIWGPVRSNFATTETLADIAYGVDVDSQGNAIVVGVKGVSGSGDYRNLDWHVRKYAAADGALIWEDTYSGSANLYDYARNVKVDENDDVLVVGYTNKGTSNAASGADYDWLMIKYAADGVDGMGQRMWTKTFESAAGRSESCNDATLVEDGAFVVAGSFRDYSDVVHRRLAKIASADGSPLAAQVFPTELGESPVGIDYRNERLATAGQAMNAAGNWDMHVVLMTTEFGVRIISPEPYSYFEHGTAISFSAELVGGAEPPFYFTWSSNRDGELGTGETLEVSALSLGEHVIHLLLEYGQGESAQASVVIYVAVIPDVEPLNDAITSDAQAWTGPVPAVGTESGPVTWLLVAGPEGMTIDEATGVVSWNAPVEGLYDVTIRAENPLGADDETFALEVLAVPEIEAIVDESVLEATEYVGPTLVLVKGTAPVVWSLIQGPTDIVIDEATGVVTWTAMPSFTPVTITILATNDVGSDEVTWHVQVLSAPLMNPLSDDSVNEGEAYSRAAPTLVKGTAPVTYELAAGPAGMMINETNGAISWDSPTADGSPFTVTIRASNSYGVDEKSFALTVVRPPLIESIDDTEILEGTTYTGPTPVLIQGTLPVSWSLIERPAGMTINTSNGVVSWPNVPAVEGPYTVTIRALNAAGSDTTSWQIIVRVIPELAPISNTEIAEGQSYIGPTPTLVKGTAPITYELISGPIGMTIDPDTGVVTWSNTTADGNPHGVTIRASNTWGNDDVSWQVRVIRPPTIAAMADGTVTKGQTYMSSSPTLDDGTLPVQWSLVEGPAGMVVNPATGVVSWPGSPIPGMHSITIRAENIAGSDDESWQLEVIAPPVLSPMSDASVLEYTTFTSAAPEHVEGTEPIVFSLVSGPAGMTIDAETGAVTWTSAEPSLTSYTISIRAGNAVGSDTVSFGLTVLSPPAIMPIADASIPEGPAYASSVPQVTKGTAPVTWSLSGGPAGMTIDSDTGQVTWPNPTADGSPFALTTIATNDYGQDSKAWQLTVVRAPQIASVADVILVEGEVYIETLELTQGTQPITWSLIQAPVGMTISNQGIVNWTAPAIEGPFTVTARAENLGGADEVSWEITIRVLPGIAFMTDTTIVEGLPYTSAIPVLTKGTLPITWSIENGPQDVTIDSTSGVVSWSDTTADGNPHLFTISASNDWGTASVSWRLVVVRAPVIAAIDDATVAEGRNYISRTPTLSNGTAPVSWSLIDGPAGMTIDNKGVVYWPAAVAQGQPHTITIGAANDAGSDQISWNLNVIEIPRIAAIADKAIVEGNEFTLQPVLDTGTAPVTWTLIEGPSGLQINASTGAISWPTAEAVDSPHSITIRATNAAGNDSSSFALIVHTAYIVEVSTNLERSKSGSPVLISGQTKWFDDTPAPNMPARIQLDVKDSTRSFDIVSDAQGQFEYTFHPVGAEAGVFSLFGEHPAVHSTTPQDTFTLVGIQLESKRVSQTIPPQLLNVDSIALRNNTNAPIEGLTVEVIGTPPGWIVDAIVPPSMGSGEIGSLEYAITTGDDSIAYAEMDFVVRTPEEATAAVRLGVRVRSDVPKLEVSPTSMSTAVVRGQQTLLKLILQNVGSAATAPLNVQLPNVSWMALTSEAVMSPLAPDVQAEVWLSLTPPESLPLGPYSGSLVIAGVQTGATVDFEFQVVSDAKGDLLVRAEDEYTYYAEGEPMVADAGVQVIDVFTNQVVASGQTDADGEVLLTDLPESFYQVRVRATKHSDFGGSIAILPGRTKIVTAFLPRQLITYTWKVEPTQIEDHYEFVLESTFETNVPVPLVTIEPADFDLDQIGVGSMQIDFTITNHGLIAAEDSWFDFGDNSEYIFTPLVEELGAVPAKSSIVVPVQITHRSLAVPPAPFGENFTSKIAKAEIGSNLLDDVPPPPDSKEKCREQTVAGVYYTLVCGENNRLKFVPVRFMYKRECPGEPGPPLWPRNPVPPEDPDDPLRKLADWLFPEDTGGGGGGIGGGLREIYDRIVSYFSGGSPDVSVPPARELGVPCDQCSFNVGKAMLQGIWDNVPALNKIQCAAGLGYNAGVTIRRCTYLGILDWECLTEAKKAIDAIREGCSGPDKNQWKESLKSIARAAWDHCIVGAPDAAVNDGFPLPPASDLDASLLRILALSERLDAFDNAVVAMLGDSAWLEADPGDAEAISAWFEAFGVATTPESVAGPRIAVSEWENLTNPAVTTMPVSLDMEVLDTLILRWNRTLDYTDQGIYTLADVPEGWDTDFIAIDALDAAFAAASDAAQATIDEGYDSLSNAVVEAVEEARDIVDQNDEGICAKVKIQIRQEAVITRNAFEATLEITNGSDAGMEDLAVYITIDDGDGNDANDLFVILPPDLVGITDVEGSGVINPSQTARATWLIVPTQDAAPTEESVYFVGGKFIYRSGGQLIDMPLFPDDILVRPDAQLHVQYFHQKDVYSDDPFTDEIEPAEPFSLGLRMINQGYGPAYRVSMSSSQPKIIENEKGLLVDFQIISSQVGEEEISPSLDVYLGDIMPGETAVARWLMTASLQGQFSDYKASYVHLDGLGDPRLSLIDSVEIHELIHAVRNPWPVDDGIYDFLVNDVADGNALPDSLYLSDGEICPVQSLIDAVIDAAATPVHPEVNVMTTAPAGYCYLQFDDPSDGQMTLVAVTRSDGEVIRMDDNAWATDRVIRKQGQDPYEEKLVHIFDHVESAGTISYRLLFSEVENPLVVRSVTVKGEPVGSVDVVFSGPIEPTSFSWQDIKLRRNGGHNLIYQPLAIRSLSETRFRVSGLGFLTVEPGAYMLIVDASGITDLEGNAGIGEGIASWRRTLTPWDATDDGRVDMQDLAIVGRAWIRSDCTGPDWCGGGDMTQDGTVDIEDLQRLIVYWMESIE